MYEVFLLSAVSHSADHCNASYMRASSNAKTTRYCSRFPQRRWSLGGSLRRMTPPHLDVNLCSCCSAHSTEDDWKQDHYCTQTRMCAHFRQTVTCFALYMWRQRHVFHVALPFREASAAVSPCCGFVHFHILGRSCYLQMCWCRHCYITHTDTHTYTYTNKHTAWPKASEG